MSKLHICVICIFIIGQTLALPLSQKIERQRREIEIVPDGNTGLVSRHDQNRKHPQDIILEIVTKSKDAASKNNVLVIDEIVGQEQIINNDDMEVAETHIFRPLFRYRAQVEKRQRVKKSSIN